VISKARWIWRQLSRKLWVTSVVYALAALATAGAASWIGPMLPEGIDYSIGTDAVEAVLTIIASSMLAVTTFAFGTMLGAFNAAATNITPRATNLLQHDRTTQKVLSTFLGSFIFSLVSVIGLKAGAYGPNGKFVLFIVTLALVALIVIGMLRWIAHLTAYGRRDDTHDCVEQAVAEALRARTDEPWLGAHPMTGPAPFDARAVMADRIGYVRHVDLAALQAVAEAAGCAIWVAALPGSFVHPGAPLLWIGAPASEAEGATCLDAFDIGATRSFDQDPRFGLSVLTEIAERALSPAVNDPGSAIDILGRAVRLLAICTETRSPEVRYNRLWVPPLTVAEMMEDVFPPIARDGAGIFAVQIRLQKALLALCEIDAALFGRAASEQARAALTRAEPQMLPDELARLRDVAGRIGALSDNRRPPGI